MNKTKNPRGRPGSPGSGGPAFLLAGMSLAMGLGAGFAAMKGRDVVGTIKLSPHDRPLRGAILNVWIEDITEEGGEAKRVAELKIRNVSVPVPAPGKPTMRFTLGEVTPAPGALYGLRVHLDVDADGEISKGDYLSMDRVAILMPRDEAIIAIEAELVR